MLSEAVAAHAYFDEDQLQLDEETCPIHDDD